MREGSSPRKVSGINLGNFSKMERYGRREMEGCSWMLNETDGEAPRPANWFSSNSRLLNDGHHERFVTQKPWRRRKGDLMMAWCRSLTQVASKVRPRPGGPALHNRCRAKDPPAEAGMWHTHVSPSQVGFSPQNCCQDLRRSSASAGCVRVPISGSAPG